MNETLSQKIGRKTFQGIANRQNDALATSVFHRRRRVQGGANCTAGTRVTDMTICTSSSIRTMTVGSGIAPDLLTPCEKTLLAWALAGS
jgi:hypothetical protein